MNSFEEMWQQILEKLQLYYHTEQSKVMEQQRKEISGEKSTGFVEYFIPLWTAY